GEAGQGKEGVEVPVPDRQDGGGAEVLEIRGLPSGAQAGERLPLRAQVDLVGQVRGLVVEGEVLVRAGLGREVRRAVDGRIDVDVQTGKAVELPLIEVVELVAAVDAEEEVVLDASRVDGLADGGVEIVVAAGIDLVAV